MISLFSLHITPKQWYLPSIYFYSFILSLRFGVHKDILLKFGGIRENKIKYNEFFIKISKIPLYQ